MSEFNQENWAEALTKLYSRSRVDPDYRALCLSDPVAAIRAVSEIELPPTLQVRFFDERAKFTYSFLLPPIPAAGSTEAQIEEVIHWKEFCTQATGTG